MSTSSANGLPAPTGASWSASPTSTTCVSGPTARSSVTISSRLAIELSSTISTSHFTGSCSSWNGPSPGIQPRAECTVWARSPLASLMRTAARPVGATSRTRAPRPAAVCAMALMDAVLPVPGPPVITDRRWRSAACTPASCSAVRVSPRAWKDQVLGALELLRRRQSQEPRDPLGQLPLELGGRPAIHPGPVLNQLSG